MTSVEVHDFPDRRDRLGRVGFRELLEILGVRHRNVRLVDAEDRCVEVVEALLAAWVDADRLARRRVLQVAGFGRVVRVVVDAADDDVQLAAALRELDEILEALRGEDPEFEASAALTFSRPAYHLSPDHELPRLLAAAARPDHPGVRSVGMSFWTDAAILAAAGIPSVLEVNCLFSQPPYVQFEPMTFHRVATAVERRALRPPEIAVPSANLNVAIPGICQRSPRALRQARRRRRRERAKRVFP